MARGLKLFVDENLPAALARGLQGLFASEHEIVALRDKFDRPGVKDEEWIHALGRERGWTVLSGDIRIAKKRPSRELFIRAGLVGFFPLPGVMERPLHLLAARVLTVWPGIIDQARVSGGGVFELGVKSTRFRQIVG